MNQTQLEPSKNPNPQDTCTTMVQDSINQFLSAYRRGATDFSDFSSISTRLLNNFHDPPLENVWFHSAITFQVAKFTVQDPLERVLVAKDLFKQLVLFGDWYCTSSALKRIALLAPVVYELYNLVSEKRHLEGEIESLLENVVSYGSIFCDYGGKGEDDGGLNSCFLETIRVWMVDRFGVGDELEAFFPLVSDEVRKGMMKMGYGVNYMAGVVMCEALLLRLCLKFGLGISRAELEKDVYNLAFQTMNGFQSFYFFDILFRMLLELALPVTHLLNSGDECILRKVLHDAVMAMDYSFLKFHTVIQVLPGDLLKDLAVKWLFVAENVIWFARKYDDQAKVISYVNTFSESFLSSQLLEWITNQTGMEGKFFSLDVSNPVAFIKWILDTEDQRLRIFDCGISKLRAKEIIHRSSIEHVHPMVKPDSEYLDDCDLEMVDTLVAADMEADDMLNTMTIDGSRKRKEGTICDEEIMQAKFVKYLK